MAKHSREYQNARAGFPGGRHAAATGMQAYRPDTARGSHARVSAADVPPVQASRPARAGAATVAPMGDARSDRMGSTAVWPMGANGPARAGAATLPPSDAVRYARGNYGSGASGNLARRAKKGPSAGKRVAIVLGCIVGALLVAALAFALWFTTSLNKALAPADEELAQVNQYLVPAALDQPFYMLLLGSDSREDSGTSERIDQSGDNQRSDVIMLVRVDARNRQVTLVTVPRDTPYTLQDGSVVKINELYNIGGAAASIKGVSELTGVGISHYAEVHVSELQAIVDTVGGVDVYVDRPLDVMDTLTGKKSSIEEGWQTLDGKQAQVFARARRQYADTAEGQDYHRQSNVRTLAEAIVKKALSRPLPELPGVVLDLAQYVTTDLKAGDLVQLAPMFAGGSLTMYSCCGPINGDIMEQYGGVWMCYPNPEGWAELMRQVDSGAKPGDIDYAATQIVPAASEVQEQAQDEANEEGYVAENEE